MLLSFATKKHCPDELTSHLIKRGETCAKSLVNERHEKHENTPDVVIKTRGGVHPAHAFFRAFRVFRGQDLTTNNYENHLCRYPAICGQRVGRFARVASGRRSADPAGSSCWARDAAHRQPGETARLAARL